MSTDDHQPQGTDDVATSDAGSTVGLDPGTRFKCEGCGNLTRFDVVVAERVARYWHVSVSGAGTVEDTDVIEQTIESVTCRWCGSTDRITTEQTPVAGAAATEQAGE